MNRRQLLMMSRRATLTAEQQAVNTILSLSPLAYWRLNETSGTTIADATGNNRTGTASDVILAQTGQLGNCIYFKGVNNSKINPVAALTSALTPSNYYVSMLVRVNVNAALQVRLINTYRNSLAEYNTIEIRLGNQLSCFLKEGGVTQTVTFNAQNIMSWVVNQQWHHIVYFNNETSGNCGLYLDGEYIPGVRQLAGSANAIDAGYPEMFNYLDGYAQHVVFFNGTPTQEIVNTLRAAFFDVTPPAWSLTYDINDQMTTNASAPLTSPRNCEPTGTVIITDTGNKVSIASNRMAWSTKTVDESDPRVMSQNTIAQTKGKTLLGLVNVAGYLKFGWHTTNAASPTSAGFGIFPAADLYINTGGQVRIYTGISSGVDYKVAVVKKDWLYHFFIKGGTQFTEWKRVQIAPTSSADLYAGFGAANSNGAIGVDNFRVCSLPFPLNDNYVSATNRLAGKRSDGDTFTHAADCLIEFFVTKIHTGGTFDLHFRQQDANNYWQLTIGTNGTLTLNEIVAGTPTSRGTGAAGSIATGQRMLIRVWGNNIHVVANNISKSLYQSASNFNTATSGVLSSVGTGGFYADVIAWPWTATAEEITYLDLAST